MDKLTELKLLIVKCFNQILLKMQKGHPYWSKDSMHKEIKEAILAIEYIESTCNCDSNEARKLIQYHILTLKNL